MVGNNRSNKKQKKVFNIYTPVSFSAKEKKVYKEPSEAETKYTKLCLSVHKGIPCRYGEKCRFAHSVEQLSIRNCFFGNECRFAHMNHSGIYQNKTNGKVCEYKHPGETRSNYYMRTGLMKFVKQQPQPQPQSQPKFQTKHQPQPELRLMDQKEINKRLVETKQSMKQPNAWANIVKKNVSVPLQKKVEQPKPVKEQPKPVEEQPKPVEEQPKPVEEQPKPVKEQPKPVEEQPKPVNEEKETVLKVPKEFAMKALEIALKMGKKNIRIELI